MLLSLLYMALRAILRLAPAGGADPAEGQVALLHRHTADAPSLAPRARQTKVDLPPRENRPPSARSRDLRARDPHGNGEPPLGLHQDPGRAPQTRHPCGGNHHQENPSQRRTRTRTEKIRSELVRVPACPSPRHLGM